MTFVKDIAASAPMLGYAPDRLLEEVRDFIRARVTVLMRAEELVSPAQVERYLTELLGREPVESEVNLTVRVSRSLRLNEAERIALERRQNDRCGLCGRWLSLSASPHVDHMVPLGQGGADTMDNLQLLCAECNLGKRDSISWHLVVPYQVNAPSKKLRYAVLARAAGRCGAVGCGASSAEDGLYLSTRISRSHGGRWVFDNLWALCSSHSDELERERRRRTKVSLSRRSGRSRRVVS